MGEEARNCGSAPLRIDERARWRGEEGPRASGAGGWRSDMVEERGDQL